ncbi:MAG: aminotransferase class V-fold PLP-dependent enzyme [Actinobacteria bacterium]|nr:aminotransferase class V-fold PLP-dependent enzyme [Actinomycetota bacterium]
MGRPALEAVPGRSPRQHPHLPTPPRRSHRHASRPGPRAPADRRGPRSRRGGGLRVRPAPRRSDVAIRRAAISQGGDGGGRRRPHRPRLRRPRRRPGRPAHDRQRALRLWRRRPGVPARALRRRPGHDPGHAGRPVRRDRPPVRGTPSRGRRPLRGHRRLGTALGTRHYFDHASSSPLRPRALEAMLPYLTEHHADPGRVHTEGHATRAAVEAAREQVGALFGARPREVVFTSSGTEAVNAAVFGAIARTTAAGVPAPALVATAVEHSSVLDACRRAGVEVELVPVDGRGRVDPSEVVSALTDETALVNVQVANHEVGTLQPAAEVAAACRDRGVLCHVDACAGAGYVPVALSDLGADLVSVTAHKMGGPKGVGALLVRKGLRVPPFIVGGAQERGRRGGIENVPAIVGFGAVAEEVAGSLGAEATHLRALTDRLLAEIPAAVAGIRVYGNPADRLPNLVCFGVEGVEAEPVLLGLDRRGIAAHSGSSCASETLEPSPVLAAMGVDAEHSLRISVGWTSTDVDVDAVLAALPEVVQGLRDLRS